MCHDASIRTLGKSGAIPSSSGRKSQSTANSTRPSEVDLLTYLRRITPPRPPPARVGALLFEETGECFSTQGLQSGECQKGARGER